jgi:hypothetical protein
VTTRRHQGPAQASCSLGGPVRDPKRASTRAQGLRLRAVWFSPRSGEK